MLSFRYKPSAEAREVRSVPDVLRLGRDWSRFVRYRKERAVPLMKDPIAVFSSEWLAEAFDMHVVMLIRHPAAFAASLKRLNWTHPFQDFLRQPLLMRDHLEPWRGEIEHEADHPSGALDQAILLWRLIHTAILKFVGRHHEWVRLRLEDIAVDPIGRFRSLFGALGLTFDDHVTETILGHSNGSSPAVSTSLSSVKRDSARSITMWKTTLTRQEIDRVRARLLILLATTLDVTSFLNRGNALRYAILLPPLAVALGIRLRLHSPYIRRLRASDRILLLLFLWGMLGTLYGILFKNIPDPLLTLFGPMAIAFLYLGTLEGLTEEEAHRLLRNIAAIGALYICLNAFVNVGIVHGLAAYRQYRNAQLLFVAIGVAGAIVLRKRLRLTVLLLLVVVIFATYPSGTAILVFLVTAATLWMTKARGSSLRPLAVGAVLAVTLMLALSNFGWGVQLSSDYFQAVGKSNNTSTRAALWQAGIEKFQESPLVGRSFSGGTTVVARRVPGGRVIQLPFHNDYILFLTAGGLLGL